MKLLFFSKTTHSTYRIIPYYRASRAARLVTFPFPSRRRLCTVCVASVFCHFSLILFCFLSAPPKVSKFNVNTFYYFFSSPSSPRSFHERTYTTYVYARFTVRPSTSVTYRTRYFIETVPNSRNSITFDPDRFLGF